MVAKSLRSSAAKVQFTTIRDFSGGLNTADNDYNLDSRFATVLNNFYRGQDGTLAIRYGTRLFADVEAVMGSADIVGMEYYNARIILVNALGVVGAVDGTGLVETIFDNEIAASLPGSPAAWGETDFVSFNQFAGKLAIFNGVNKPLQVTSDLQCQYLVDAATGSNFYVPLAAIAVSHGRYHVLAGDSSAEDTLYISSKDTFGTFQGATPPNDGVNISLGSRIRKGSSKIQALASFRDKLIVFCQQVTLIGTLGVYTGSSHTPTFDDVIEQYGAQAHLSVQAVGDDMFFSDFFGIPSLKRALFTGEISPRRESALIDPTASAVFKNLDINSLEHRVFSIYNVLDNQYMVFVPNDDNPRATTETVCLVRTIGRESKERSWAVFRGWNWKSTCRSQGGRVFFSQGPRVFVYGTADDPIFGDYVGYEDAFTDGTAFDDGHGWSVELPYAGNKTGVPINADFQTPWADFSKRMLSKYSKYVGMDTFGTAIFTLQMFADNIIIDRSSLGEDFSDDTTFSDNTGWSPIKNVVYLPQLEMQFIGGDALGFGGSSYGMQFGDGRPTPYELGYAWPAKFKVAKFRILAYTRDDLRIASLSIAYSMASIRR